MSSPAGPNIPQMKTADHTTSIDLCNTYLFTFAVGIVLLEFVGSFFKKTVTSAGLQFTPALSDLPLLLGLLILFCGNFNFYKRIIEPRGESPGAALFSLIGMLSMASLPLLMLFQPLFRFRYLILAIYVCLVTLKNEQLRRRFASETLKCQFRIWRWRATIHLIICIVSGCFFYFMVRHDPHWKYIVSLVFNSVFAVIVIARFIQDQDEVDRIATTSDL
jgi:hypothetical protein